MKIIKTRAKGSERGKLCRVHFSTLEIHFLFFVNEFHEGTYPGLLSRLPGSVQYLPNLHGQLRNTERFLNKSVTAPVKYFSSLAVDTVATGEKNFN